jgi:hypothetical protein
MRNLGHWLRRSIVDCLVLFLAVPIGETATALAQQTPPSQQAEGASSVQAQQQTSDNEINKEAPTTIESKAQTDTSDSGRSQTVDQNRQTDASQTNTQQKQNSPPAPVGTAAAPYVKALGVPGSKPAGAAIAPAKQRRTRSVLIKVGILLGVAVAIGTVAAASSGSPSRPH